MFSEPSTNNEKPVLTTDEVWQNLPQKPPFLFVDKIVNRDQKTITTEYFVTGEEYFFRGHFPGNPIVPGVILQEALFQSGNLLMATLNGTDETGLGVVTRVENAKFRNLVRPGDRLQMEVSLDEQLDNAFYFSGKTKVNGKVVVVIKFTCAKI